MYTALIHTAFNISIKTEKVQNAMELKLDELNAK